MIELQRDADESGQVRLALTGELTIFTAAQTRALLLESAPGSLALGDVTRVDSAGLQVLLAWQRSGQGRRIAWASASEPVRQLVRRWRLPEQETA